MQFELTEEHLMIQKAAREFAQNELKPGVIDRDEKQQFPRSQVMKFLLRRVFCAAVSRYRTLRFQHIYRPQNNNGKRT